MNFIPNLFKGVVAVLNAIGELPMTFWGVVVLFSSMWIAVHFNKESGYYFAGIGSTLLGINPINARNQSMHVQSVVPPNGNGTGAVQVDASTTAR